jgi:hypothetical protein
LVITNPSGVNTKPEPEPPRPPACFASMRTTDGAMRSTADITALE